MHHQGLARLADRGQHALAVQRMQRAQIDDLDFQAVLLRGATGGDLRVVRHQAPGEERQVVAFAGDARRTRQQRRVLLRHLAANLPVAVLGLEEEHRVGVQYRAVQQAAGVARGGGHHDFQAGNVGEERLHALAVVKAAAGHRAVGHADHQGHVPAARRAVIHARRLTHDLVEGRVDEIGELNLADRPQVRQRRADAHADDAHLRQRRIHDAPRAVLLVEPLRGAEDAAAPTDVLAGDEDPFVLRQRLVQRAADGLDQGHVGHQASPSGNGASTGESASSGAGSGAASAARWASSTRARVCASSSSTSVGVSRPRSRRVRR